MRHAGFFFLLTCLSLPVHAASSKPAVIQEDYSGGYKDDFPQELSRVRTYISIAQQDIATRLGLLQYGPGFYNPVTIRFDDGAPNVNENPFFYIQTHTTAEGFSQELIVNVEAYARHQHEPAWNIHELRNSFYYAMTQLILNDVTEGHSTPATWVYEGLAVYLSDMGPGFVQQMAKKARRSDGTVEIDDLNQSHQFLTDRQWAPYFLAINYIATTGGVNALQGFVRNIIDGKSAAEAVLDTLGQQWPAFTQNVKTYSTQNLTEAMQPDEPATPTNP